MPPFVQFEHVDVCQHSWTFTNIHKHSCPNVVVLVGDVGHGSTSLQFLPLLSPHLHYFPYRQSPSNSPYLLLLFSCPLPLFPSLSSPPFFIPFLDICSLCQLFTSYSLTSSWSFLSPQLPPSVPPFFSYKFSSLPLFFLSSYFHKLASSLVFLSVSSTLDHIFLKVSLIYIYFPSPIRLSSKYIFYAFMSVALSMWVQLGIVLMIDTCHSLQVHCAGRVANWSALQTHCLCHLPVLRRPRPGN